MLWLFGQIWLWLVISFALGAAVTALLLTRSHPVRAGPGSDTMDEDTEYFESGDYDDSNYREPEPVYPPRAPEGWSPEDERTESGRREGILLPAHFPTRSVGCRPGARRGARLAESRGLRR
jgi:hypothetical protein